MPANPFGELEPGSAPSRRWRSTWYDSQTRFFLTLTASIALSLFVGLAAFSVVSVVVARTYVALVMEQWRRETEKARQELDREWQKALREMDKAK